MSAAGCEGDGSGAGCVSGGRRVGGVCEGGGRGVEGVCGMQGGWGGRRVRRL